MIDTNQGTKSINLDTLTDEQVLQLKPEEIEAIMGSSSTPEEIENTENIDKGEDANDITSTENEQLQTSETIAETDETRIENSEKSEKEENIKTETLPENSDVVEDENKEFKDKPVVKASVKEVVKPEEDQTPKKEPNISVENQTAIDFYTKVSAPFKADGKEIQVRSAEDAIRFMQMGVNYSRRMQEMKPMRAMNSMLEEHGLNDASKLSFLIDLKNGKPEAIKQLLKEHKIDPIDLSSEDGDTHYRTPNYAPDPRNLQFKDAVDNTLNEEGGPELIRDINANWDDLSKEALADQPAILSNLLEQKKNGIYERVVAELVYQRTAGYLVDVPFLQAYRDVSHAMEKAGILKPKQVEPQIQSVGVTTPIDTGTRKVVQKKSDQPNPSNLSSTPIRPAPSKRVDSIPDYATMSDEDFLKQAPPA